MIVTTSQQSKPADIFASHLFSKQIGAIFVHRRRQSLSQLYKRYPEASKGIYIIENEEPVLHDENGRLFFHPGMSLLRIRNIRSGGVDPIIDALGLRFGMHVLDCTFGLGSDALVIASCIGHYGTLTGIESSISISAISEWGIKRLASSNDELAQFLRKPAERIQVLHADHADFLRSLPSNSFDVVYFDPMFRTPRKDSPGMKLLHQQGDQRPLSTETISHALRVCRERVVVKETAGSTEFDRLGFKRLGGGRYSPVRYGIMFPEDLK